MNRTARYKLTYLTSIVGVALLALAAVRAAGGGPVAYLAVGVVLLIPGRVQGHCWRDLLTGRRLLDARRYAEAVPPLERFLAALSARPWLRHLVWLGGAVYTRDPEVMARTNLGAAHLELGALDAAERELRLALARDPEAPLPWYNLAIVLQGRGDAAGAEEAAREAVRLGFARSASDIAAMGAARALARVEGRPPAAPTPDA